MNLSIHNFLQSPLDSTIILNDASITIMAETAVVNKGENKVSRFDGANSVAFSGAMEITLISKYLW